MHRSTELSRMFSSVRQSVVGIDSKSYEIIFANPAAKSALGFNPTGKSAQEILACDILAEDATDYLCGTTVLGRKASVSVVRENTTTLLFIDFFSNEKPSLNITRQMISNLRADVMGLKMSSDRCFSSLGEGKFPVEKSISIFYHYYYSLLRTLIQIDSADQLGRGELLFSPVAADLVTLCSELTDTVALLCSETGVNISFTTSEKSLIAAVDPPRIEQLLLNLFSNSLKHTSAGNSVTLSLVRTGNRIVISLDDDGDGIPQEVMSNIFKLSRDGDSSALMQGGNGLGLYIAFGIAQLHNGVILVESREGSGTRVRFMLPTDSEPAPKFNSPATPYYFTGSSNVLSGLADILPSSKYGPKYED